MASLRIPKAIIYMFHVLAFAVKHSVQETNESFVTLQPVSDIKVYLIQSSEAKVFWYKPVLFQVNNSYLEYAMKTVNEAPHLPGQSPDTEPTTSDTKFVTSVPISNTSDANSTSLNVKATTVVATNGSQENSTADIDVTSTTLPPSSLITTTAPVNSSSDHKSIQVPYVKGIIIGYHVFIKPKNEDLYEVFDTQDTEYKFSELQPGTEYSIIISIGYKTKGYNSSGNDNIYLNSSQVTFTTTNSTTDCFCNKEGLKDPSNNNCNHSDPYMYNCECKEGYTGFWCQFCAPKYYSLGPGLPCRPCPCNLKYSVGTCRFDKGKMKCEQCRKGYSGQLCHECDFGYFVYQGKCVRCNCHGNGDTRAKYLCHPRTGACSGCLYNTTGFSCERCKDGYIGDAINDKCLLSADVSSHPTKLHVGVIAAICIGVILLLSIVTGILVYRRCHGLPNRMPFWTVELKEDHEGVNFSTLPEHDDQMVDITARMDDMDFYDSIKGHESSQKYSPLKETV